MKTILLTGGCGFIGSHTCYSLLKRGYKVVVIDSCRNSNPESLNKVLKLLENYNPLISENLLFFKGDLRNNKFMKNAFEQIYKDRIIDGVIHFAGLKSVQESFKKPLLYWDVNINSTINLLNFMQEFSCRRLIFSSSATVYGNADSFLINEESLINPINPYGSTKAYIEKLLSEIQESSNKWNIANLRYFNPIGAHSSGMIGENPLGKPNNIFPLINLLALGDLPKLEIYGRDWDTPDGTCIRDYVHVMDVAEGHVLMLEYLFENDLSLLNLNLGTGRGTTVLELLKTFEEVNSINLEFQFSNRRIGDVDRLVADNALAREILKWQPKRSIEDMCRDGWNWQSKNPFGYETCKN